MTFSNRAWLIAHALLLTVTLVPILASTNLPLVDLPNHIARVEILSALPQSADLQKTYSYHWSFVPNLAFDVFAVLVARVFGVLLAAKLFCVIAASALYIGTVLLHRTLHGRFSVVPMAAAVLVYNGAFLFGFVNYVLGVGLALCAVAAWVAFRNIPLKAHVPLFAAIGVILMSVHLYGFGLFGVVVFGLEIDRVIRVWRRGGRLGNELANSVAVGAAPAVLPVLLFFAISPTQTGIARNVFSTFQWKAEALAEPLLFYFTPAEFVIAGGFAAVFAGLLILRIVVFNIRMTAAVGLLIAVFLAMPRTTLSSGYADYRMPAAIALFGLASLDWHKNTASRASAAGGALILALDIAKIAMIASLWLSWQPALAAYATAFAKLSPGAALFPVEGTTESVSADRRPPIVHMPTLAAARGIFVPTLFGDEPGFLLKFKPSYLTLKHMGGSSPDWEAYLRRFQSRYTYVLVNRPEFVHFPPDIGHRQIASGPTFVLYQLIPP